MKNPNRGKTPVPKQDFTSNDNAALEVEHPRQPLTIDDLGWTEEQAAAIRGIFASVADDWDNPIMDVYDDV